MRRTSTLALLALSVACLLRAAAQETVLTKARAVRALSPAQAEEGRRIALRGTVIFVEGPTAVFMQDETSGAFFRCHQLGLLRAGDLIEIQAQSRMGLYLPGLDYADFKIVGSGPLPPGISASYEDLLAGRFHYQRVSVEGVVHSVSQIDEGRSLLRVAMGSRVLDVRVERPPDLTRALVDGRVRVTGLASGFVNERRQLVQPYLRVIDWPEVTVLAPAVARAAVPLISAEALLAFQVAGRDEHRVRLKGVVTSFFSQGPVYLRGENREHAFTATFSGPVAVVEGDRVELVGFPAMEHFSGSVIDAELIQREPGAAPAPLVLTSPDLITGRHDANLLTVTATVADAYRKDHGVVLVLEGSKRNVQAQVPEGGAEIVAGSQVTVTGICRVESIQNSSAGFTTSAAVISLRARSAQDVRVQQAPSWWTTRHLLVVLGLLLGLMTIAGLWITALRIQVTRQTAMLRRKIATEAALEERQRLAREFHDTLEQELAGVSLRLNALATRVNDEKGRDLVATSCHLVNRIQVETRDLITDLRDPAETAGDLLTALATVATRYEAEGSVRVRVAAHRPIPALPAAIVHDLRMIARESINNALKHGRATQVVLEIEATMNELKMRVKDDGEGFDAATVLAVPRNRFGCAGMRERCRKMKAAITWQKTLPRGTTVEVTVPFPILLSASASAPGKPSAAALPTEETPGKPPRTAAPTF